MRPLITSLLAKLAEVHCGFNKIEEIIQIYEETRENADERFQLIYGEAITLTNKLALCWQQKNRNNIPSEAV